MHLNDLVMIMKLSEEYLVTSEYHHKDKVDIVREMTTVAGQENNDEHEHYLLSCASDYIVELRGYIERLEERLAITTLTIEALQEWDKE